MRPRKALRGWRWLALIGSGGCGCLLGGILLLLGLAFLAVLSPLLGLQAVNASAQTNNLGNFPSAGSLPAQVTHAWMGPENASVVAAALYVASGLDDGPPDGYDTWYDPAKIPAAIAYWQRTCPGCAAWAQGNLQCVMLVAAAYGLAGQPLPYVNNAILFWKSGAYRHQPGWAMIPPTSLPYPGDMLVLDSGENFGGVGHIVIVVDVKVPDTGEQDGYVQFAEANGPGAILQMPLREDASGHFTMGIWRGYTVMGYIRHVSALAPA